MAARRKNNGRARKAERRASAESLQQERALRSDEDQVRRLDVMFGEGEGATKERVRLNKRLQ